MIDLGSLPVAPTMFLLVSPLSTRPTTTVELIMVLGFLCILRLFVLFTFLSLATITVRIVLAFTFALSPALSGGAHVHRNWTRDHRVTSHARSDAVSPIRASLHIGRANASGWLPVLSPPQ